MKNRIRLLLLLIIFATLPTISPAQVRLGIDELRDTGFEPLQGKRVGLITNPTGVDSKLRLTVDILHAASGVKLVALLAPEHGVRGNIPAGVAVDNTTDPETGIKVYSLYSNGHKPRPEVMALIDVLVFDIQDIGSRSYTFISTMGLAMEAAAESGKEFIVLDRPNPMGGLKVEGCGVSAGYSSFVSKYNIPYIHGMTVGEIAGLLNSERMLKGGVKCKLKVIKMSGWKRSMTWQETGLSWIATSPHIPTWQTALHYPITGIIGELGGINIGIGYTLPFQFFAAEWIDRAELLAANLNKLGQRGVYFRPTHFRPFYGSSTGKDVHGVQIHITDYSQAQLLAIPFNVLQEILKLYPQKSPFVSAKAERTAMFDKVIGNKEIRERFVASGYKSASIISLLSGDWFMPIRQKYLLY